MGMPPERKGLIIHAPNVHQGGGRVLLAAVLGAIDPTIKASAMLDARFQVPGQDVHLWHTERVKPSLSGRLWAEWRLYKLTQAADIVLCFGNLPPLLKSPGRVVVFIQNRYQLERRGLAGFPARIRIRIWLERLWFRWGLRWAHEVVVQTPSMARIIEKKFDLPVRVLPFVADPGGYQRRSPVTNAGTPKSGGFLYVATAEPHKGHRTLIEAWCLLAQEGIRPVLRLTVDKQSAPELANWIETRKDACQLNVEMTGEVTADKLKDLYQQSSALVYPSTFESFGLPLIEARQQGLAILSGELDYVRDLVDPEETFDPSSPVSISRAIKRFLHVDEASLNIVDARTYLAKIMAGE